MSSAKTMYARWLMNSKAQKDREFALQAQKKVDDARIEERAFRERQETAKFIEAQKQAAFDQKFRMAELAGKNAALQGKAPPQFTEEQFNQPAELSHGGQAGAQQLASRQAEQKAELEQQSVDYKYAKKQDQFDYEESEKQKAQIADEQRHLKQIQETGVDQYGRYRGTPEEQREEQRQQQAQKAKALEIREARAKSYDHQVKKPRKSTGKAPPTEGEQQIKMWETMSKNAALPKATRLEAMRNVMVAKGFPEDVIAEFIKGAQAELAKEEEGKTKRARMVGASFSDSAAKRAKAAAERRAANKGNK